MKRFLWCPIVLLFLSVSGIAADLEIVVPEGEINPNQHYLFSVIGLTAEDLPTATIICEPTTAQAVGVTGWAGEQFLWWIAREKGRHFVAVVVVRNGKAVVASATVEVGTPKPDPPVPPVPGDLAIVVVFETTDRTAKQMTAQLGLRKYLISKNLWYRIADLDTKNEATGATPKWLEAARAKVAKKSIQLPALVVGTIADGVFSPVAAEVMPDTVESAVNTVKKYQPVESHSLFVPTPIDVVKRMLAEAKLTSKDVLYDLGSGDGRIPILAAKLYGCRAVGIEIDSKLVLQSRANAKNCGVENRVRFYQKDCRETDFTKATVVTLYLDESLNGEVASKFGKLASGVRIVSHDHKIPGLPAERTITTNGHTLYFWNVPLATARLSGSRHAGPHGSCLMCLGNHLIGTHKVLRTRLDAISYKKWSTIHDNAHNKGGVLACAP